MNTLHPDYCNLLQANNELLLVNESLLAENQRVIKAFNSLQNQYNELLTLNSQQKSESALAKNLDCNTDITNNNGIIDDFKKTENRHRISEERYRRIMELTPTAIFVFRKNRVELLNQAAIVLSGATSADQILGKSIFELFLPMGSSETENQISKFFVNNLPSFTTVEIVRLDGSIRKVEASAVPVLDDEGFSVLISLHDITEQIIIQESLHESEERFRNLFQLNQAIMMLINPDTGGILDANQAAAKFYDYSREQLQKMYFHNISQLPFDKIFKILHESVLGQINSFIFPHKLANGQVRYMEAYISPIQIKGDSILFSVLYDITNRRVAEEQLKHRAEELSIANKELESYSYSVSHDLRGPLNSIIGFNNFLIEDYFNILDENGRTFLLRIRAGAIRMNELIDCLLKLSRISVQKMDLQEVNLSKIAETFFTELKASKPDRLVNIQIEKDMFAYGDKPLLELAITNLIRNAWKFTFKTDTASIIFASSVINSIKTYFICDNGAGFDMRYKESLFHPFQRLHSDEDFRGTGIGLATVDRVIKRHGGKIWAEGRVNKGATFFFILGDSIQG